MTREEFLREFDGNGNRKPKGYEEFGEAGNNGKKKPFSIYKPPKEEEEDKPKPPPPTPPVGGAALPIPKAAMKHEGFKSFSEWLEQKKT